MVQWLSHHTPDAEDPDSILGHGTRSHMLKLRVSHATTQDPSCHKKD